MWRPPLLPQSVVIGRNFPAGSDRQETAMFIHPEISRELASDRQRDMLAQAEARRLTRLPAEPRMRRLNWQPVRRLGRALRAALQA
jgi:hypothetical protein